MAADRLARAVRGTLVIQLAMVAVAATIAYLEKGTDFAAALAYGGAVAFAGTLVSAWRLRAATEASAEFGPGVDALELFKGTILKLVLMIALLVLGLAYLRLEPLAVIAGFVVAQMAYLFSRSYAPRRRR